MVTEHFLTEIDICHLSDHSDILSSAFCRFILSACNAMDYGDHVPLGYRTTYFIILGNAQDEGECNHRMLHSCIFYILSLGIARGKEVF